MSRVLRHVAIAAFIGVLVQGSVQADEPSTAIPDVPPVGAGGALYRLIGSDATLRIDIAPSAIPDPDGDAAWHAAWQRPVLDPHGGFVTVSGGAMLSGSGVFTFASSHSRPADGPASLRQAVFTPGALPCGVLRIETASCLGPDGPVTAGGGRWDGATWRHGAVAAHFVDGVPFASSIHVAGGRDWDFRLQAYRLDDAVARGADAPSLVAGEAPQGIDDTGLPGFGMQDAWSAALSAPTWPYLRSYLEDHPDAAMTAAIPDGPGWRFEVGDDQAGASFRVQPADPRLALFGPRPEGWVEDTRAHPTVGSLATAQSILDRAAAWSREPLDRVGFRVACGDGCAPQTTYHAFGGGTVVVLDGDGRPQAVTERSDEPAPRLAPLDMTVPGPAPAKVVATSGLAAAAIYLAAALLRAPLAGLFSRVSGEAVAKHPLRCRILDAVQDEPGIHMEALRRSLDLSPSQVQHHVAVLLRSGLLGEQRDGRLRRLHLAGAATSRPPPASDGARQVLSALSEGPSRPADLARATRLHPSTVGHHLKRMAAQGHVRRDGLLWRRA